MNSAGGWDADDKAQASSGGYTEGAPSEPSFDFGNSFPYDQAVPGARYIHAQRDWTVGQAGSTTEGNDVYR
jgi:hypothetical protein